MGLRCSTPTPGTRAQATQNRFWARTHFMNFMEYFTLVVMVAIRDPRIRISDYIEAGADALLAAVRWNREFSRTAEA
jgi:hypothetical protein